MKPLIIGAGSVGLGLASFLANTSCRPVLVGRSTTNQEISTNGIVRDGIFGERIIDADRVDVIKSIADAKDIEPDFICICVKTPDNNFVASQLSELDSITKRPIPIVLFQNGWGGTVPFDNHFGIDRVFSARVITGFTRPTPNHVSITVHADDIHIGSIHGSDTSSLTPLVAALNSEGLPTIIVPDISKDIWAKLFYNNALNSLGAILDVPYGFLGDDVATRRIIEEISNEGFKIMSALSYSTHWNNCNDFLAAFYSKMLPPTYAHISSTLQDIHKGTRTEIEYLNGAIVREGFRLGIPTPVNTIICDLVRFIENHHSHKKEQIKNPIDFSVTP